MLMRALRKPKTKPAYEVIGDREECDDEANECAISHASH
jgi:hypothetical protein